MVELTKESVASVVSGLIGWKGIHKAVMSPTNSNKAVCIASIQRIGGYYGASFELRYSGFRYASKILISYIQSGADNYFYAYQTGLENDTASEKFYSKTVDNTVYIYAVGTYPSDYSASLMDLWSADNRVSFDVDNSIIDVDSNFLATATPVQVFKGPFGYNTLAELSSGVAEQMGIPSNLMSGEGLSIAGTDLNELNEPGCYAGYSTGDYVNIPSGVTTFILVVRKVVANWSIVIQDLYSTSGYSIYKRMKWGNNTWGQWYKL